MHSNDGGDAKVVQIVRNIDNNNNTDFKGVTRL